MWLDVRAELGLPLLTPDLNRIAFEEDGRLDALVARICAELPDGELFVTGCSLGASIAVEVAAALGERVRGLLLVTPQPVSPDTHYREGVRALCEGSLFWDREQLLGLVPLLLYPSNPRYKRSARVLERMLVEATGEACVPFMQIAATLPSALPALERIRCERRAIFGKHSIDPFCGPDWIPAWRKALGAGRVLVAEEASEFVVMERPELVAQQLRQLGLR